MEFSRQEYWSGLPFSSPGDLPDSGIKPKSPALQPHSLMSEPPGKLSYALTIKKTKLSHFYKEALFLKNGLVCIAYLVFYCRIIKSANHL